MMNYRKKVSAEGVINSGERGFSLGKFSALERDRRTENRRQCQQRTLRSGGK